MSITYIVLRAVKKFKSYQKNFFTRCLRMLGFSLLRVQTLSTLKSTAVDGETWQFVKSMNHKSQELLLECISQSKSELRQDIFVIMLSNYNYGGYFVEFGATDGITGSNTYLLEKKFDWRGLLVEPAKYWHAELEINRNCTISNKCVWKVSDVAVEFIEHKTPSLSSILQFSNEVKQESKCEKSTSYQVTTISLLDLLVRNKAPFNIDYISLDTEGSEFEILNAFDFSRYQIGIITVEHNFTKNRQLIYELLTHNNFSRVAESFSGYDDFYVNSLIYSDIISE